MLTLRFQVSQVNKPDVYFRKNLPRLPSDWVGSSESLGPVTDFINQPLGCAYTERRHCLKDHKIRTGELFLTLRLPSATPPFIVKHFKGIP